MANSIVNELQTVIAPTHISFDADAFDALLRGQGVKLVHYRAMRCPVGMIDLDDNRRPHPDHVGCTNGFVYTKVGTITALFTGNSKHKNIEDIGWWDGSTVQVSFPRSYDQCDDCDAVEFFVAPFDRFYLHEENIMVPTWQLFLHNETGLDRLKYPVVKVEDLMDARGDRYAQDTDFTIALGGQLKWGTRQPTPELQVGPGLLPPSPDLDFTGLTPVSSSGNPTRGAVCSVRYLYRPFWYVGQLVHEIRVSQIGQFNGPNKLTRMPQAAVLHREYVSMTKQSDEPGSPTQPQDADTFRIMAGPSDGGFEPR